MFVGHDYKQQRNNELPDISNKTFRRTGSTYLWRSVRDRQQTFSMEKRPDLDQQNGEWGEDLSRQPTKKGGERKALPASSITSFQASNAASTQFFRGLAFFGSANQQSVHHLLYPEEEKDYVQFGQQPLAH